jgi:hypothetical protein
LASHSRSVPPSRLAVFAFAFPQIATANCDPLVGTWNYLPDKSTYKPGPALQKHDTDSRARRANDDRGIDAQKAACEGDLQCRVDGKPHPVTGIAGYDNATWNKFSATATGYVYMRGRRGSASAAAFFPATVALTFNEKTVDGKGKKFKLR